MQLLRCLVSEFIGTAFLLATVVGSGILLHKADAGNTAVTVFGIAVATGCTLVAICNTLGSLSAQFNPMVALMSAIQGNLKWKEMPLYVVAQVLGAIAGVVVTNLMFEVPAVAWSETARTGSGQWIGELVATFGLLGVIIGCSKSKPAVTPFAVSAYVLSAIMFTSSTCFANPAVTIARAFTPTITGIIPGDIPAFIGCQLAGGLLSIAVFSWLFGAGKNDAIESKETMAQSTQASSLHVKRERDLVGAGRHRN